MILHPTRILHTLRRVTLRLSPPGRRHLAKVQDRIDDEHTRPGLTDLDEEYFLDGPAGAIKVYRTGPTDARYTVVFIHGFTLAADAYFAQVDFIREQFPEVACLLLDLRGHGDTAERGVDPDTLTIDGTADDVIAVIEHAAKQGDLLLVGHSMGGMTAFSVLRRAPQQIAKRIVGLVAIDTAVNPMAAAGTPQLLATQVGKRFIEAVVEDPDHADELRHTLRGLLAPALAATVFHREAVAYDLVEFHASMIDRTPTPTFVGFYPDLRDHDERDVATALADLPGAIVVGEQDDVTPVSQAKQIHKLWPKASFVTVDTCGHMAVLEAPAEVNTAIADVLEETSSYRRKFPTRKRAEADKQGEREAKADHG
ncbi:alpha/beta fold hydrolase [Corynebacterium choanae]|uniref:Short chain dehydrogenase n=1 Tax=Corynebacterium choanae TaxID=1862358 RepID=A0A3G6J892_9CORY|nr:alpha/beta hydrolase [Corynebacterium choanae]AZA14022.1 short chain dehydrogenase [Corynebacterium choanae]